MDADFSELYELVESLESAPKNFGPYARKAVEVTARKVKDSTVSKVKGRKQLGHAAYAIDYELQGFSGPSSGIDAEIGYNKGFSAGRLGNLIEFGAPGSLNRLSPGSELQRSLAENQEDFVRGLAIALDDSLKASRL